MSILTGQTRILILVLTLLVFLGTGAPLIAGSAAAAPVSVATRSVAAAKERLMVLATIESRMNDQKALEKMREKVDVLGSKKLRLAAALCDRMARDGDSDGADLAFSLVTALIVLG